MVPPYIFWLLGCCLLLISCEVPNRHTDAQPVSHELWGELLQKHVSMEGWVDYQGFASDSTQFNSYLALLQSHYPNPETWTNEERLAYWINAYNAFTVQIVLDHYPVASIKDIGPMLSVPLINSVWDIEFISIEGQGLTLNDIEHGILRKKFGEPRIHFAINCASASCPNLLNRAYTPEKLEEQLQQQTVAFINDPSKNKLAEGKIEISSIFNWFGGDFKEGQTLLQYIQRYSQVPIADDAEVNFLDYDWSLNDKP